MGEHEMHRAVVERMQSSPDAVVLPFLGRLRDDRAELEHALGGRSLRAEVVVHGDRRAVYRITFTPAGRVELTGAYGFDPHLRIEGSPEQVVGLLLGGLDTFQAVCDGVLTLHFPVDDLLHFPPVRAVLARRIEGCDGSHL